MGIAKEMGAPHPPELVTIKSLQACHQQVVTNEVEEILSPLQSLTTVQWAWCSANTRFL